MFIVTERRKFLAAHELGATTTTQYRHACQGEPALNQRLHMSHEEADSFDAMIRRGKTESRDITASKIVTYTITDD